MNFRSLVQQSGAEEEERVRQEDADGLPFAIGVNRMTDLCEVALVSEKIVTASNPSAQGFPSEVGRADEKRQKIDPG
jgi:hypothetical protein